MATVLHKIKAWLYDNLLTQDNPNNYIARVYSERSLGMSDICEMEVTTQYAVGYVLKEPRTAMLDKLLTVH
ncbi:MAG: hypothetical protein LBP85_04905 [Prevotellaceae bacterium]|jgi:hypothetical protein|nr:hypothetical protein [Prevotellaceae bacterium]